MNEGQEVRKEITGRDVALGFLVAMAMHGFNILIAFVVSLVSALISPKTGGWIGLYALFNPGITQYLYLVPLAIHYRRQGEAGRFRGVLNAMGFTILLNSICWAVITR